MRWSIFDKRPTEAAEWSGFLERGTKLEGKLESPGTLRLETDVRGSVVSETALILGEHAQGTGELTANSVVVAGRFEGIIRARQKVELQAKAVVSGEVETPNFVIEPGAIFDGECRIVTAKEPAKPVAVRIRSATHQ